jgi:iron complex outermembrane receptor protein
MLATGPVASWAQQAPGADPPPAEQPSGPDASRTPAAPPSDVEVIRIKGRAVTGIETEVPASVTQFAASDLQALGAQNVSDLAKVTPNVEIKTTGSTSPTFFIRGVGLSDFSANAAGAVAIYRDDAAINAPAIQLTPLFDLENVQILRGPQGTGDNRNASAGSIKMYSRKPTGDLTAELRSSFGNFDYKDFEGAVEAPIVDEMLSSRLAFRWTERGPIMNNRCGNQQLFGVVIPPGPGQPQRGVCSSRLSGRTQVVPNGLPDGVNDQGNWAARGVFRFQPPEVDMDWLLNLHGSRIDQLSTLGQAYGTRDGQLGTATAQGYVEPDANEERIEGGWDTGRLAWQLGRKLDKRPFSGDFNRVGDTILDTWGATLRGDWTLGDVTLTNVSNYETYDRSRSTDQDFSPDILFESESMDDAWQYFQRLSANGELTEAPFRWDVGAFYLMEELDFEDTTLFANGGSRVFRAYTQDSYSYGVWAAFAWDFLDDFTLEGGARWNWDQKVFDLFTQNQSANNRTDTSLSESSPTGELTLTYRFDEGVSAYWKYTHGWKPMTINSIAVVCNTQQQSGCAITTARPETIDAWETGLRGNWLDGRLQASSALFYYKYTDYQVFIVADATGAPPTLQIVNANDAQVFGAELELRAEPLLDLVPPEFAGLVLTARGSWLESKFIDFTTTASRGTQSGILEVQVDFSGNQLINSPRFKASGSAEWTFDLGRWGALIPRYDFAWTSDIYFDANEGRGAPNLLNQTFLPKYAVGQRRYWLHNVRLGYRVPESNIEIAGWCRNCTDQVYKTYGFDASTFAAVVINFVGEPRTYGLDLVVRF